MRPEFKFHKGYYDGLHPDPSINFQLNRWISYLGEEALNDLQGIAPRLLDLPSYRREFLALAEKALSEGRDLHAAYYFRSAEFFMRKEDPLKNPTRQKFLSLVWDAYAINEPERLEIPYTDGNTRGTLPAYHFPQRRAKSTIVLHGGFDSYIEEFFPMMRHLHDLGYEVICFEGPGQGGALLQGRPLFLTEAWDKPLKASVEPFQFRGNHSDRNFDGRLPGIAGGGKGTTLQEGGGIRRFLRLDGHNPGQAQTGGAGDKSPAEHKGDGDIQPCPGGNHEEEPFIRLGDAPGEAGAGGFELLRSFREKQGVYHAGYLGAGQARRAADGGSGRPRDPTQAFLFAEGGAAEQQIDHGAPVHAPGRSAKPLPGGEPGPGDGYDHRLDRLNRQEGGLRRGRIEGLSGYRMPLT